jgi:phosphatidylglycerol---prolipoprotein diacylglyceryl transferase
VLPNIQVFGLSILTFQLMLLLAILAGAAVARAQAIWLDASTRVVWDLLPYTALAGIIGAQVYGFALTGSLRNSGMVFYGGLLAGVPVAFWRYRRWRLPWGWFVLGAAPAIALGHAVGRIGCFLAGDDWGRPTKGPFGVAFPNGSPPSTAGELRVRGVEIARSIPDDAVLRVHPTQLYEAGFLLILFLVLLRMTRRGASARLVAAAYLGAYGLWRFCIEFLRVKNDHVFFNLTTAQVISFALMCGAVVVISIPSTTLKTEQQ